MSYNIELKHLLMYIKSKNWDTQKFTEKLQKLIIEPEVELIIPSTEDIPDYESRMNDLIYSLSIMEDKPSEVIIEQMKNIGYDLMKIRFIANATEEGTMPLMDFADVINNVKRLITYSACSEIQSKSQYRRPFNDAKLLVENCEFVKTEAGSFVISIRVPLGKTYLETINTDNKYLEDLGRKSVIRLISGINEAEKLDITSTDKFVKEYDNKLNRNVCEAVSSILRNEVGFDMEINLKWDPSTPPEKIYPTMSKIESKKYYTKFNKMAALLKKIPETKDVIIKGRIKRLITQETSPKQEKQLITIDVSNLKRKVYLYLNENENRIACNAYRDKKLVEVNGKLNKKIQHWVLDNPKNFKII